MEKNGNTFAPGDTVLYRRPGEKNAAPSQGEVVEADPDVNMVRVKFGTATIEWIDAGLLVRGG